VAPYTIPAWHTGTGIVNTGMDLGWCSVDYHWTTCGSIHNGGLEWLICTWTYEHDLEDSLIHWRFVVRHAGVGIFADRTSYDCDGVHGG